MKSSNEFHQPAYKILEEQYAKFVGTKYAVAVNSGTSGLHLSLVALGIGPGDEVIVPDFTMAACGFAVAYTGATVVTVDCGHDLNIDPELIEAKITPRTKAIMPVHIYGRLCDMNAIKKIAKKHNLFIVEDGCEAQGAAFGGNSDCLVFSFYRNKIIHAQEGGIVCTDNKKLYDRMQFLKNMAFDKDHTYFHSEIGFNYRMADSQALMVLDSLAKYPKERERREWEECMFDDGNRDAVWVLDTLASSEKEREQIVKSDPNTRRFFKPLSTMPMWKQPVGKNALKYSKIGYYKII